MTTKWLRNLIDRIERDERDPVVTILEGERL